jgi:hypothetical protein
VVPHGSHCTGPIAVRTNDLLGSSRFLALAVREVAHFDPAITLGAFHALGPVDPQSFLAVVPLGAF